MTRVLKIVLPIVALLVAVAVSYVLFLDKPEDARRVVETQAPLVSVAPVKAEAMNIPVYTRGTVTPGTQVPLISEVNGRVLEVSPNFVTGGFFQKDEVLFRVDPREYDVSIKRAEASVAQTRQLLLQAEAERKARVRTAGSSQLARFEVQVKQAEAHHQAAKAELEALKMQRDRTVVRAPFDGRVLAASISQGQFLRPGMQIGAIYAVDVAEVRLPLSDRQLAMVDVPGRMNSDPSQLPEVILSEEYAGKTYTWKGQVVRAEGSVNEHTRLQYLVAEVPEPYALDPQQPGRPQLVAGSFVEAKISGRFFERVFAIPRGALRHGTEVWVVGDDGRLDKRQVGVLYRSKDTVYVTTGIDDGDQIVLGQLDVAVQGMKLRTRQEGVFDENEGPDSEPNPFAGRTPVDPAISGMLNVNERGVTLNVPPEKAQALAAKAGELMEQLPEDQQRQLKAVADKLAQQQRPAPTAAAAGEPAQAPQDTAPVQQAAQAPRDISQASQAAQAHQPAQPAGMSPLAAQLEADIAAQQLQSAAEPTPVQSDAQPAEPSVTEAVAEPTAAPAESSPLLAGSNQTGRTYVIATAVAPKPLKEASH